MSKQIPPPVLSPDAVQINIYANDLNALKVSNHSQSYYSAVLCSRPELKVGVTVQFKCGALFELVEIHTDNKQWSVGFQNYIFSPIPEEELTREQEDFTCKKCKKSYEDCVC